MQKIIAFFAFSLLLTALPAQSAKWVFKEKDGSERVEIRQNQTVEVVWRSDDPRSVSTISADFLGIRGDSIILENSAGTAFSRPLKEARSIKIEAEGRVGPNKRGIGWGLIGGAVVLWLIGFGIILRSTDNAPNPQTGVVEPSNAQSTGCCLTSILGLAALIVGIVMAASGGAKKSHSVIIEQPAKNWTIKKVDIP